MDFRRLKETIDDYDKGVERGKDSFGKSLRDDAGPIMTPPFL